MTYDDILIQQKTYSKEQVQILLNHVFEISLRTFNGEYKNVFKTHEEYMAWVIENVRQAGFPTKKIGSSWGVL